MQQYELDTVSKIRACHRPRNPCYDKVMAQTRQVKSVNKVGGGSPGGGIILFTDDASYYCLERKFWSNLQRIEESAVSSPIQPPVAAHEHDRSKEVVFSDDSSSKSAPAVALALAIMNATEKTKSCATVYAKETRTGQVQGCPPKEAIGNARSDSDNKWSISSS